MLLKSKKLISKVLISAIVTTGLVIVSAPASKAAVAEANAAASFATTGLAVTTAQLRVGTFNATATADARMITMPGRVQAATDLAISVGLAAQSFTNSTSQSVTMAQGGQLSLYTSSTTSIAISATGGTITATASATSLAPATGWTSSATAAAFIFTTGTSAVATTAIASGVAVIWTAPSTAGTYYINSYVSTDGAANPSAINPLLGTQVGYITVTVGGSHAAVGGTNNPDTLGATNQSLFLAVADNTGPSAVIHPTTTPGLGAGTALSKGILSKDTTFRTAQTATVLPGAQLSLYANVSTTTAITASGGSFSLSQGGPGSVTATYSGSLRTTLLSGPTPAARKTIATVWTAPTTAGTYTVSLYVDNGAGSAPSLTTPEVSLGGNITVTVVAASAGGAYSAAYSACNIAPAAAAITAGAGTAGIDNTVIFKNGDAAYINLDLNDAYNANLAAGNLVVTATNGALVNIGAGSSGAAAGTSSTDVDYIDGAADTIRVEQGTAGAPVTTTVTATYNGTTVCTKTITIRGAVAKLTVAHVGVQKTGNAANAGNAQWMYQNTGTWTVGALFSVVATDSAGNVVNTPSIDPIGTYSADAATLTTTVNSINMNLQSTTSTASSALRYNYGAWGCDSVNGQTNLKIKFTTTATGAVVTSDAFVARCGGDAYTYTASLDKAAYNIGDIATATVKFLDSKGVAANTVTSPGAGTWTLPFMTGVDFTLPTSSSTAVTTADGSVSYAFTIGTSTSTAVTAGTFTGIIEYAGLANSPKATTTYKLTVGSDTSFTEVLKSVVALIASINKQIQALQKLILQRR